MELNERWNASLAALAPREVHLVLPASLRPDLASSVRGELRDAGVTHALLSKLDEVPYEHGVAELAARVALPVRWVTDGQDVPADLHAGWPRIVQSLGVDGSRLPALGARPEAAAAGRGPSAESSFIP